MPVTIERAQPGDWDEIASLVQQNGLPIDGLVEHLGSAVVARHDGRIVGCAALEVYEDGALLRSVAVAPDRQRHGIGHLLTTAAVEQAGNVGAPAVYLLTTTAERFFPKFGFERIGRADVPPGVQHSVEFTSVCCASAVVMRRLLPNAGRK